MKIRILSLLLDKDHAVHSVHTTLGRCVRHFHMAIVNGHPLFPQRRRSIALQYDGVTVKGKGNCLLAAFDDAVKKIHRPPPVKPRPQRIIMDEEDAALAFASQPCHCRKCARMGR